ncbi:hypothetical protein YC2023_021230 [Brassica napus]
MNGCADQRRKRISSANVILFLLLNGVSWHKYSPSLMKLSSLRICLRCFLVWRDCLSVGERSYLQQFLPQGVDVELVVQQLLGGENFHFGSPFLDWPKSCAVEKEKSQRPLLPQENAVNVGVKARKRDKLPKLSVQQSDGAKYGKRYSHRNKDVINSLERELKDKLNAENSLQKHDVELDLRKNDQESLNPNQRGDLAPDWPGKTG